MMNRLLRQALAAMICLAVVFAAMRETRLRVRQLSISHAHIGMKSNRSNRLVKLHKNKVESLRSESQWDCPKTDTVALDMPVFPACYHYSFRVCYRQMDVETPPPKFA